MSSYALFLRLIAPSFLLVGALHLTLGVGTEGLLGVALPAQALASAGLDSQNRFYGVSFTLYGILLFICAGDVPRYATVLRCIWWVLFVSGLARLVSIAAHGLPPGWIIALLASEMLLPPLALAWLSSAERSQ